MWCEIEEEYISEKYGNIIGSWLRTQKKSYNNIGSYRKLTDEKINLLNKYFPNWNKSHEEIWDEEWYRNLNGNVEFYLIHSRLIKQSEKYISEKYGHISGLWLTTQRRRILGKGKRKQLTIKMVKNLNELLPTWHLNNAEILEKIREIFDQKSPIMNQKPKIKIQIKTK